MSSADSYPAGLPPEPDALPPSAKIEVAELDTPLLSSEGPPEGALPSEPSLPAQPAPLAPPARKGLTLVAAFVTLVLTFLGGFAAGTPHRRGLGFWVDENLLEGVQIGSEVLRAGAVVLRSSIYDAHGNQVLVRAQSSLGAELVTGLVYGLLGLGALLYLLGRRPALFQARGGSLALRALGYLTPLILLGAALGVWIGATWFPGETTSGLLRASHPMLGLSLIAWLYGLRFVLLGPLAEELVWRGVVYGGLRARLSAVPAAVVSALAFVSWHYLVGWRAIPALALHYLFSLVACRLTETSRSLWPAIGLHVLGNACALGAFALVTHRPNEVLYVLGLPR